MDVSGEESEEVEAGKRLDRLGDDMRHIKVLIGGVCSIFHFLGSVPEIRFLGLVVAKNTGYALMENALGFFGIHSYYAIPPQTR